MSNDSNHELTINEIIDYVHSLCRVREKVEEKEKTELSVLNEINLNEPLILSLFSALISKFKTLNIQDKNFYVQKYIECFVTELKKKNIYLRYTTDTNIIDKKVIAKDLKNINNIEDYNNFLIFFCMFFNLNIFVINENTKINFYSSNQDFNIYKHSIVLKRNDNGTFNIIMFKNETLSSYYNNDEFKKFIDLNKTNILTLKQNLNFGFDFTSFNIQDDKDIEHIENSNEAINKINKDKQYKNQIKSTKNTEQSSIKESTNTIEEKQEDNKQDNENFKNQDENLDINSINPMTTTEKIKEVLDFQYTEEELKKMTLVKLKELTREYKLRITDPKTKKPFTKSALIENLINYSNN